MVVIPFSILAILLPIVCAAQGAAYRGLYFAVTLFAGVVAMIALGMTGPLPAPTDANRFELRGAQVLNDYAPPVAAVLFGLAFGCAVGGCAFRAKVAR